MSLGHIKMQENSIAGNGMPKQVPLVINGYNQYNDLIGWSGRYYYRTVQDKIKEKRYSMETGSGYGKLILQEGVGTSTRGWGFNLTMYIHTQRFKNWYKYKYLVLTGCSSEGILSSYISNTSSSGDTYVYGSFNGNIPSRFQGNYTFTRVNSNPGTVQIKLSAVLAGTPSRGLFITARYTNIYLSN